VDSSSVGVGEGDDAFWVTGDVELAVVVHGVVVVTEVDHVGHVSGPIGTVVEEVVGVGFSDPGTGRITTDAVTVARGSGLGASSHAWPK
jgi:hypothetical protein